jgi:hypothetical protein
MRVVWGVEEQPVDPVQRGLNLLDVEDIRDGDLGAHRPQSGSARIVAMHQGPGRYTLFQELGGHRATDLARSARYQYARVCHWSFLPELELISRTTAEPARRVDYLRGKRVQM